MSGPQGTLGLCGLWAKEEPGKVSWLGHSGHSGTQEKGRAHPRGLQGASKQELWGERGWSGRDTTFPWPRHGGHGTEAAARRPSLFLQAHLHNGFLLGVASWLPLAPPTAHTQTGRRPRPTPGPNCNPSSSEPGRGRGRQSRGQGTLGLLHGRWARRPRHTHGPRQPVVERRTDGRPRGRFSRVPTAWTARGGARWWWPCPSPVLAQFPSLVHPTSSSPHALRPVLPALRDAGTGPLPEAQHPPLLPAGPESAASEVPGRPLSLSPATSTR